MVVFAGFALSLLGAEASLVYLSTNLLLYGSRYTKSHIIYVLKIMCYLFDFCFGLNFLKIMKTPKYSSEVWRLKYYM